MRSPIAGIAATLDNLPFPQGRRQGDSGGDEVNMLRDVFWQVISVGLSVPTHTEKELEERILIASDSDVSSIVVLMLVILRRKQSLGVHYWDFDGYIATFFCPTCKSIACKPFLYRFNRLGGRCECLANLVRRPMLPVIRGAWMRNIHKIIVALLQIALL